MGLACLSHRIACHPPLQEASRTQQCLHGFLQLRIPPHRTATGVPLHLP